jgi:hypothetical protein
MLSLSKMLAIDGLSRSCRDTTSKTMTLQMVSGGEIDGCAQR